MMRFSALSRCAVLSLLICAVSGCVPSGDDHLDEKNDPSFVRGRALVQSQDFPGAIEEFEKALEVNPHSAAAHFELGWLCEEKLKDYASAIYHYQKHLALQPNSDSADKAKEHIIACKRELAKGEFAPQSTQNLQREIDRLTADNTLLKQQLETTRAQLVATLAAPRQTIVVTNYVTGPAPDPVAVAPDPIPRPAAIATNPSSTIAGSRPHSHVVKRGETMASIAQQYNVKLRALQTANPKVDARRLKAGQTLTIP